MKNDKMTNTQESRKLAIYSFLLNLALTCVKYLLYIYTNSSALLAETLHSLIDVIAGLFVILGIYISDRKSKFFPWGLYKIENIGALIVAVLIIFSGFGIAKIIYKPLTVNGESLDLTLVSLLLMAAPILLFARYEEKRAKALRSPLLIADAENWKMDIAPLLVVTVGILGTRLSFPVMDRIAAFVILLLIFKAGYDILKDSLKSLLDASVDKEMLDRIRGIVMNFQEVKEIGSLEARNAGRFLFINIEISITLENFRDAHHLVDTIADSVRDQIPYAEKVVIHYEPVEKD